ncbi:MAG: radical SAM protein [Magnetococcales bacterium]|nr:radical SAM protein [Magnetococcales bacterium]
MKMSWYLGLLKGILQVRALGRPVPLMTHWEITYRCNLNCTFCGSRLDPNAWGKETSTGQAKRIIDQLAELGTRVLNFVGGEPTLRSDLGDLLAHARSRGLRVAVTTNGVMDDQRRSMLLEADVLRVSLEGAPELNRELRRAPPGVDGMAEAIRTLEFLVAHNRRPAIGTTYSRRTRDADMDYLASLCRRLGIRMSIVPVDGYSFGDKRGGFDLEDARERQGKLDHLQFPLSESMARIQAVRARHRDVVTSGEPSWSVLRAGGLEKVGCLAMNTALSIKPNGDVALPCIEFPHRTVSSDDLRAAFYGPEAQEARRRQGTYWFCSNCQLFCMVYASSLVRLGPLLNVAREFVPQVLPQWAQTRPAGVAGDQA